MTPAEILAAGQTKHWTRAVLARRPDRRALHPSGKIAIAWYAVGALRAVYPDIDDRRYRVAESQLDLAARVGAHRIGLTAEVFPV